jgi:DNA-binding winged helix-turn-helix (wHTH) protein/tetratricopeptide (TPR) repeat protein
LRQSQVANRFLEYVLDPLGARLWRGDEVVPLRPKTFALLELLLARRGRLVGKDELLGTLWGDAAVSEGVLTSTVKELRRALADDSRAPRLIETVHRRGYRFIAEVTPVRARWLGDRRVNGAPHPPPSVLSGRAAELALLGSWLDQARTGSRQIGLVSGEAGIGKSSLMSGFLSNLGDRAGGEIGGESRSPGSTLCLIARGQCLESHGVGREPYLPVLEALRRLCRTDAGGLLVDALHQYAPSWVARLPGLLDAETDASSKRRSEGATDERMLREMSALVEELPCPLVLAIEDLHWGDPATLDLISRLAYGNAFAPLLLIGTYRPGEAPGVEPGLKYLLQDLRAHALCKELEVPPLRVNAVADYLRGRCPGLTSTGTVAKLIRDRTEGNPLFIVSMVDRLIAEGGLAVTKGRWKLTVAAENLGVGVPTGLRNKIRAQIDRLTDADRHALEAASLLGRHVCATFVAAAIERPVIETEARLDRMARNRQAIRDAGETAAPDGTVAGRYEFVHSIYRDVLRDGIPPARRRDLHARLAKRLESAYGTRALEIAGDLAVHFEACGMPERAVEYLERGAARATTTGATHEPLVSLRHALALLERLPATRERELSVARLCLQLGQALQSARGHVDPESAELFSRAWTLSESLDDPALLFQSVAVTSGVHIASAAFARAVPEADRLQELMTRLPFPGFQFAGQILIAIVRYHSGDLREARTRLEDALALEGVELPANPRDFRVQGLNYLANTLLYQGHPDQARERMRESLERSASVGSPFDRGLSAVYACFLSMSARDLALLDQASQDALLFGREYGFPVPAAVGEFARGRLQVERGDRSAGLAAMTQGLRAYRTTGQRVALPALLVHLSDALALTGDIDAAHRFVEEGLAFVRGTGEIRHAPALHRVAGDLAVARNEPESAIASLQRSVALARQHGSRWLELRASLSLAHLHQRRRDRIAARDALESIARSFDEGRDTPDLDAAHRLLAELS